MTVEWLWIGGCAVSFAFGYKVGFDRAVEALTNKVMLAFSDNRPALKDFIKRMKVVSSGRHEK